VSSDTPGGGLPLREKTLQEIYQAAAQQQNQVIPSGQQGQGQGQNSSGQGAPPSAPSAQGGKFGQVPAQKLPGILPPAGGTSFAYDGNWNLTKVTDALATTSVPDLQGTTTMTYDELGEPIEIDRPFDGTHLTKTYYGYDADGNQLTSDTPQTFDATQTPSDTKFRTTNSYDGLDRLTETDAPGSAAVSGGSPITRTTTYCYALAPANGTSPCTPSGQPSENVGSIAGTKSGQTFAIARRVAVVAPSNTSTSGAQDNVTYKDYDAIGNLVSQIAPPPSTSGSAPQTTYAYDPIGDQTEILRPLGQPSQNSGTANTAFATTMAYDAAGRLQQSTRNNTEKTTYSYDQDGNVKEIDRPGAFATSGLTGTPPSQVTKYIYNGRDLLWRTTTGSVASGSGADQRTTVTEYDGDGNLRRTVNPAGVDSTGMPFNTYDGGYTTDTSTATSTAAAAANLDATIRVYTKTNALADIYEPWGCYLRAASDKTSCLASTAEDTRRFKMHYDVDQANLNRVTGITEAYYDWTAGQPANPAKTTYTYLPNNWISRVTGPSPTNGQLAESYNYTYDAAGDQTQWKPQLSNNTTSWNVTRTYWPSGQVDKLTTTDVGGATHHTPEYFYFPSGAQKLVTGGANGTTSQADALSYFPDGHLQKLNDKLSGTVPTGYPSGGYDTVYSYDLDGNVLTRQQGGTAGTSYIGGTLAKFGPYNGNDQETSLTVTQNDTTDGTQPARQFTTSYWPSGQPQTRTRIQCATAPCSGTPISENYFYNDDGTISQDNRSSDTKAQSYSYDTDGNRSSDEIGTHQFNAMDQEVKWTRGSSQNQANPGKAVTYVLDGTGGMLQQVDDAGGGSAGSVTTWYCSQATITTAQNQTSPGTPAQVSANCQHDGDRVEAVAATSTSVNITNKNFNYCYDSLGYLARVTTVACPTTDSAVQSLNLQTTPKETQSTTSVYQHDSFGDQTAALTADAKTPSNSDLDCYSYDGLDRRFQRTVQTTTGAWPSKPSCSNSGTTTAYGYIGQSGQIAIETTGTSVPQIYDYNSTGQKLGVWEGPSSKYYSYGTDAKGSIEGLEDSAQTIDNTNRYHYTPYGALEKGLAQGGGTGGTSTTPEAALGAAAQNNNYRFEGFYEDSGIGTYDLLARNYLPQAGTYTAPGTSPAAFQPSQFSAQDALESALGDQALRADPLTQNLYAFAGGNPTNNIEWDGHDPPASNCGSIYKCATPPKPADVAGCQSASCSSQAQSAANLACSQAGAGSQACGISAAGGGAAGSATPGPTLTKIQQQISLSVTALRSEIAAGAPNNVISELKSELAPELRGAFEKQPDTTFESAVLNELYRYANNVTSRALSANADLAAAIGPLDPAADIAGAVRGLEAAGSQIEDFIQGAEAAKETAARARAVAPIAGAAASAEDVLASPELVRGLTPEQVDAFAREAGYDVVPGRASAANPATRYYVPGTNRSVGFRVLPEGVAGQGGVKSGAYLRYVGGPNAGVGVPLAGNPELTENPGQ
jgi:YD repeat-containing protein